MPSFLSRARSKLRRNAPSPTDVKAANASPSSVPFTSPTLPQLALPSPKLGDDDPLLPHSDSHHTAFSWVDVGSQEERTFAANLPKDDQGYNPLSPEADLRRQRARLSAEEVLPLVRACSKEIKGRGLETLGIFRPWRLSESASTIATLIDSYLKVVQARGKQDRAEKAEREFGESLAYSAIHDIVAVLKWGLRHLHLPGGFSPATSKQGADPFAWLEKLRAEPKEADIYSTILPPLLPKSHLDLLDEIFSLTSHIVALAETNGMSSTALSHALGYWLFGGSKATSVDAFIADIEQASHAFEYILHIYLRAQKELPLRLREVVNRYPASSPPFRSLRTTLTSPGALVSVGDIIKSAFGAVTEVENEETEAALAWSKLTEDDSFERAIDDDAARAITTASPPTVPMANGKPESPTRRRSLTLDVPRPMAKTSETEPDLRMRQRNLSDGPIGRLPNSSTSALPLGNSKSPSWSDFAQGGFGGSAVDLGLDDDLLKSSSKPAQPRQPAVLHRRGSRKSQDHPSAPIMDVPLKDQVTIVPVIEPPRVTSITLTQLDGGLADLFLDVLAEHDLRKTWPTFALVRLRRPLPCGDDSIRLLLIEHGLPPKPTSAPKLATPKASPPTITPEERKRDKKAFASFGRRTSRRISDLFSPEPRMAKSASSNPVKSTTVANGHQAEQKEVKRVPAPIEEETVEVLADGVAKESNGFAMATAAPVEHEEPKSIVERQDETVEDAPVVPAKESSVVDEAPKASVPQEVRSTPVPEAEEPLKTAVEQSAQSAKTTLAEPVLLPPNSYPADSPHLDAQTPAEQIDAGPIGAPALTTELEEVKAAFSDIENAHTDSDTPFDHHTGGALSPAETVPEAKEPERIAEEEPKPSVLDIGVPVIADESTLVYGGGAGETPAQASAAEEPATPLVGVRHSTDPGRIEEAALAIEPEDLALAAQEPAPILETSTQDESPVDDIHAAHLQAEPIAQASIESDIVADDRSASASPLEERHEATEVFDEQPATRVDASREERAPTPVEAAAMEEPRVLVEAATPPAPDEPAQSVTTSVGVEEEAPIEGRYDEAVPNQGAADEVWPAVESSTSASEDGAPSTKRDEVTIAFIVPDNGDRPERTAMSSTQETIGAIRDAEAQLEKPEVEKEEDNEPAVEVKGKPVSGQEEQHEPIVEQPLSPRRIPGSPGRFVEDLPSSARVSRDGARSPTFQLGAAASSASRPSSPETTKEQLTASSPARDRALSIGSDQGTPTKKTSRLAMGAQKLANTIRRRKSSAADDRERKISTSTLSSTRTIPPTPQTAAPSHPPATDETFDRFASTADADDAPVTKSSATTEASPSSMSDDTAATSVLSTPASTDIFLDTASTDVAPAMTPKQAIAPVTEEEEVEGTPEAVVPDLEERASTPISLPPAIWAAGDVYHAEEMREATTATLPPGLAPASEPSPFDDDDKSDAVEGERTPEVASDIAQAPTPHFDEPSLALGVGAREEASAVDAQAISSKLPAFDPRVSPPSSPIKPLELDFSKTPVRAGHSNSSDELDTPSRDERRTTPRPLSATDLALQDMAYAAAAKASEQERREDDEAASTRRDSFETAERSPPLSTTTFQSIDERSNDHDD